MTQKICLILMPFDKRKDASGRVIDFQAVYERLVVPAVEAAGLYPVRGGQGRTGIDGHLLERLTLCDHAVVDLTAADPAVFYQLGVRHALKRRSTLLIYALERGQLPLDVQRLEAVPYRLSPQGQPEYEAKFRTLITGRLKNHEDAASESPLFPFMERVPKRGGESLAKLGEQVRQEAALWDRLERARQEGGEAVRGVDLQVGNTAQAEPGLVLELFFAYRQVHWWSEMVELVKRMPSELADSILVQEQLSLALNRMGKGVEAEQTMRDLIARRGLSSVSYGKLGRILKYQWEKTLEQGNRQQAKELLEKAATAYLKGFEADWRDTYAGVNAVTLMELKQPADPRRREILPVVYYAVEQSIRSGAADYWDFATLLELAVLSCDEAKGIDALGRSLARVREAWEPQTTAKKLKLIRDARMGRGAECPSWADAAMEKLLEAAARWGGNG
ncbi:hypothetical protein GMSM_21210 [Geomonas sp. Red276]